MTPDSNFKMYAGRYPNIWITAICNASAKESDIYRIQPKYYTYSKVNVISESSDYRHYAFIQFSIILHAVGTY